MNQADFSEDEPVVNQTDKSEDEPIINHTDNSEEIDHKYINKVNTNSNSLESLEKSQK